MHNKSETRKKNIKFLNNIFFSSHIDVGVRGDSA